ncbi:hypothetical protein [Desulfovibrio sp. Fe33]|uniref:hypothetical protein n=1 Tax=Desulfovibrio sp. Fe33 TaxID=3020842 RepID=UPI00234DAB3E|nr:hypothetical protein [Desulfovibrio sp. Fe33]
MSNNKLEQFLFWRGQYVSRNPEFIRLENEEWAAIDVFVEATPEEEDDYWRNALFSAIESLAPLDLWGGLTPAQRDALYQARKSHQQRKTLFPADWTCKEKATDILDAVASETFPENLGVGLSPVQNPWVEQIKSEGEILDIRIDVSGNMAEALESVRLLMLMTRINSGESQWRQELEDSLHGGRPGYPREVLSAIKRESPSVPIQRLHNRARAIGIWLYDQVEVTGEHNLADHCRRLRDLPQFESLGFAGSEDSVFRRHFSRTCECIQAGDVLPFR